VWKALGLIPTLQKQNEQKPQKIISIGKDVDNLEPWNIAGGNIKWCSGSTSPIS
jgi:hypothetical protein